MTARIGLARHPWIEPLARCWESVPGVVVQRHDAASRVAEHFAAGALDGALLPTTFRQAPSFRALPVGVALLPGSGLLRLVQKRPVEHPQRIWKAPNADEGGAVVALLAAARWRFPVAFTEAPAEADAWLLAGDPSPRDASALRVLDLTQEWHDFLGAPILWRLLLWREAPDRGDAAVISALCAAAAGLRAPDARLAYRFSDEWLDTIACYARPTTLVPVPGTLS